MTDKLTGRKSSVLQDIWAGKIGGRIWSKIGPYKLFSMDLERLRPGEELESEFAEAILTGGNLRFPCDPDAIAVMREDIGQRLLNESGRGVIATQPVDPGAFVLEYRGELITAEESRMRSYNDLENTFLFEYEWQQRHWCSYIHPKGSFQSHSPSVVTSPSTAASTEFSPAIYYFKTETTPITGTSRPRPGVTSEVTPVSNTSPRDSPISVPGNPEDVLRGITEADEGERRTDF
ncbi:hypothetical protein Q8A67_007255 [Cirrhinus molitorella]|uniref:SET domain-containing protein n=1 Tax=Cirrhinus molitorella TaxID=172907 RepID=A0AA88TTM4_9TELE|nr:hypothetical protein Q8A67_007255 [Cirrhinus molitorella]